VPLEEYARWAVGEARRRAGQERHDLAAHVDGRVVVVPEVGRDDAEAGEDDWRVDLARAFESGVDQHVLAVRERRSVDGERRLCGIEEKGAEPHLVKVRAAVAGRLRANGLELRRDVRGRDVVAARAGLAPFQRVTREKVHVGADGVRSDGEEECERGDHGGPLYGRGRGWLCDHLVTPRARQPYGATTPRALFTRTSRRGGTRSADYCLFADQRPKQPPI
jgi:hypothetical protein